MIDPARYLSALGIAPAGQGGQELILGEIIGLSRPGERFFIPFPELCPYLSARVQKGDWDTSSILYFGTPTIVDDRPLFPVPAHGESSRVTWTKKSERDMARYLCRLAQSMNYRLIISGLGSGDISTQERLEDMGGGEIVTFKKFDTFTDTVLVRELRK